MSKVLVTGYAPLPLENMRLGAPSLRTWQFTKILLDAGHKVCLIANRGHGVYPADLPEILSQRRDNLLYHNVSNQAFHTPAVLQPLVDSFQPDCAVGASTPGSAAAVPIIGDIPLWADMFGSLMAEAQMKAQVYGDDRYLLHFWELERVCLERADVFSTIATRQKWALVGELGIMGRLNQWTTGYEFAHPMPTAIESSPFPTPPPVVRGVSVPAEAFIILYTGGYNTWVDVDILFAALERVMEAHPQVWFVTTGGKIDGHDDITYARFEKMVRTSRFAERFKLQGWVPTEELPAYYLESDIGISTDKASYEGMLGSRTRTLEWLRAGLPPVMSELPELATEIREAGAGITYKPDDLEGLVAVLERCIGDRELCQQMRQCARELLLTRYTFAATAIPAFTAWADNPRHAPDYGRDVPPLVAQRSSAGGGLANVSASSDQFGTVQQTAVKIWRKIYTVLVGLGAHPRMLHGIRNAGRKVFGVGQSTFSAAYLNHDIPSRMTAGETVQAQLTAVNRGRSVWQTPERNTHAVNLSYHWLTVDGVMHLKDGLRTALSDNVLPGQQVTIAVSIKAPHTPGTYQLEIDFVREGVNWFSEVGVDPLVLRVEVVAAG